MFGKSASCGLLLGLLLGGPASAFLPLPSSGRRLLQRPELKARTRIFASTLESPVTVTRNSTQPWGTAASEASVPSIADSPPETPWLQPEGLQQLREDRVAPFEWPTSASLDPSVLAKDVDKDALRHARMTRVPTVCALWDVLAEQCGPNTALVDPSFTPPVALTFQQVRDVVLQAAAGLQALGLQKGDHVSLFSENSAKWLVIEQGCARQGLPTAVRGSTAPIDELQYIYSHSDSRAVVLQDAALLKKLHAAGWLESRHGQPSLVVLLRGDHNEAASLSSEVGCPVLCVEDVLAVGSSCSGSYVPPVLSGEDLHTLVYTSGTTGRPKGVMLTNHNIRHQIQEITLDNTDRMNPGPSDVVLSLLPCWHIFERSAELFALGRGASLVYSSIRNFKNDLQAYKPQFLIVVPRLLESVHKSITDKFALQPPAKRRLVAVLSAVCVLYHTCLRRAKGLIVRRPRLKHNPLARAVSVLLTLLLWPVAQLADVLVWKKVREALGGKAKLVVSGGSALAKYLENFYQAAGIQVVSGYGLTETSPVIAVRRTDRNVIDGGVVGKPPAHVELKIVGLEDGREQKTGRQGVVLTRGPQVMAGYYKDPIATSKAIDRDGWFNTGDLGFINPVSGDLVLTGRAKDVIVLSNGENIEPQPIEDAILEKCSFADQVMLVGQDQRSLGALVVINPMALVSEGLLSKEEGERLADMVGPTAVMTGCKASSSALAAEAKKLNRNPAIKQALLKQLSSALVSSDEYEFREYERVKACRILLEPFSVTNGLITQTLKTKRNVVTQRYAKEIVAMYGDR